MSRGFAIAPPNADDPPPNRTKRRKAESPFARKLALNPRFLAKTVISDPLLRRPAQRLRGSSRTTIEAMGARCSGWGALLLGPRFPIRLHRAALAGARPEQRRWIAAELVGNLAIGALVFGAFVPGALSFHLLAMAAGQCMTAFFAVWTVHHGCSRTGPLARTVRNRFRAAITFSMFFHLEHHLFPQVPTARLHILARRLDAAAPEPRLLVW
ncbi:MAG TPA: fatty acid desaturase [Xanthobacteraceae bacterium]|nr:fatty acid desaturase [Xanthobacteraceae bacterium]